MRNVIENIRNAIEASRGTHIWSDYVNSLKLISQVVFTRSSGFILELIQNAEDAGLDLETTGVFELRTNKDRVKITHNGSPFSETDVRALCGIRSSKKPEKGTLGYLGIGFKSVFKVTDNPEIYSNGFQFKFDRNAWSDPSNTPWHVIPIWIDKPSEIIDPERTTFILHYREKGYYSSLLEEVKKLRTELYLFLRWLKKIKIIDEVSGQSWILENVGDSEEGITILKHDSQHQKFRFFRRSIEVPDWVKQDRLTQEYRTNVTKREIAIAFALDKEGNLAPSEAGAMFGGVYSFLPLGEAMSGAKFPIQADFLVQPGRTAINIEAKWNHWLVEEVASLCKEAIEYFKKHEKWMYQFLPSFEFTKSKGHEDYEKLFGPKLIEPIEKFLEDDACIPTVDGDWAKPMQVVKLTEDQKANEGLIALDILNRDEIASVMGGQPEMKLASHKVIECESKPIKKVNRLDLLNNFSFLEEKAKKPDAPKWFRNLYLWLHTHPLWIIPKRGRTYQQGYWYYKIVLTANGQLSEGRNVWLPDFKPTYPILKDPILKDLFMMLQKSKPVLHPDILAYAKDEKEQETIRGFLIGLTGVQVLDSKIVCKETLLPKILTNAPKPPTKLLLKYTIYCQQILGEDVGKGLEFWVLTKQGEVRAAKEVLFSTEFKPEQNWETYQQYVPGISFISTDYLGITIDEQLRAWRQFFKAGGVKDAPENGVEEFAMNYAEEKLKTSCKMVTRVEKRNFGYDLEAETQTGEKMHIEVKGIRSEKDVELTGNETEAADKYKNTFYLCVVSSIPENPAMFMVQNPAAPGVGKKEKLTIPINTWKAAKWQTS